MRLRAAISCSVLAGAACHGEPPPASIATPVPPLGGAPMRTWSFEEGTLPPGWSATETNSDDTPGAWIVADEKDAPEGGRILRLTETQNSGATFNLFLTDDPFPADLDLAVWLRADSGKQDRGGGLLWRAQDAHNYWIARWNPLERNVRLYVVRDGERRMIADAKTDGAPNIWHELRVTARGAAVSVALDGVTLLSGEDAALPGGGMIGLWTKADAATSFDALRLSPLAPPAGAIPGPLPR
jgi:hypothetical protein